MISCDHCKMVFKYNCHLDKHLSRKFPCFTNIPTELNVIDNEEKHIGVYKNMGDINTNIGGNFKKYVGNEDKNIRENEVLNENIVVDYNLLKPYHCDKCDKRYVSKRDFKRHAESCDGLNVLQCPTCHKTFSHRAAKSRHLKNVKCSPPEQPVQQKPRRQNFSQSMRLKIACEQDWKCGICIEKLPSTFQVDHIVPVFRGGDNSRENGMALCVSCHATKTQNENIERHKSGFWTSRIFGQVGFLDKSKFKE